MLNHGDRTSLCELLLWGKKLSIKERFGGRFSRGSWVQLHPWMALGELYHGGGKSGSATG